jgi:hypothetical protein
MTWLRQWINRRRPRTLTGWIILGLLLALIVVPLAGLPRWYRLAVLSGSLGYPTYLIFTHERPESPLIEKWNNFLATMKFGKSGKLGFACSNSLPFLLSPIQGEVLGIKVSYYWYAYPDLTHSYQDLERSLRGFPHLQSLVVSGGGADNPPTEPLLHGLAACRELRAITLYESPVTDAELALLQGLPELEELEVRGPGLTDACLPTLLSFKKLKRLTLDGARLSPQTLRKLQQERPFLGLLYINQEHDVIINGERGALRNTPIPDETSPPSLPAVD